MKLASYNIQYGFGLDGHYDVARILAAVREADVICLQEVTRGYVRNHGADMIAEIAALMPDRFMVFSPATDTDAGSAIIDGKVVEKRFQFGNMVISKTPILAHRMLNLPRRRSWDHLNLQRCATEALIDTAIGPLRIYSVHLDHRDPVERIEQLRFLVDRVTHYPAEGGALTGAHEFGLVDPPMAEDYVIMGDFNMQPETPEYRAIAGIPDPYYGRSPRAFQPCDALATLAKTGPGAWSWTEPSDRTVKQLLDYAFISPGLVRRLKNGWIDNDAPGSDHMPIWIELA